jgi:hypothetical protein
MGIRRGEEAFHFNPFVDLTGKTFKFALVHLFTDELFQSPFEASLLGRAIGDGDDHFFLFLFNLIAY